MKVHIYMEFQTYEQALDFKLRTLITYDPMGYDTYLEMSRKGPLFVVSGSRYASCD